MARNYADPEEGLFSGALNEKNPLSNYSRQDYLDALALTTMPMPVAGDITGFVADANNLYENPKVN